MVGYETFLKACEAKGMKEHDIYKAWSVLLDLKRKGK